MCLRSRHRWCCCHSIAQGFGQVPKSPRLLVFVALRFQVVRRFCRGVIPLIVRKKEEFFFSFLLVKVWINRRSSGRGYLKFRKITVSVRYLLLSGL